jgi:isopentenyl-diphosphate delta-isomerase
VREYVTLVDESGRELGAMEKLEAHRGDGRLHLAFSILVFDAAGALLLQRRADGKYHFAGRWSNTCCGHPKPGEAIGAAARRRLREEFGFETNLREVVVFQYSARDETSSLIEDELLHVFVGRWEGEPQPDPHEIGAWRWITAEAMRAEMKASPDAFTPWLGMILERVVMPGTA